MENVDFSKPIDYVDRYMEYLKVTDEKQIIAEHLNKFIKKGSILDIGAGNGLILDHLDFDKKNYTAVENKSEFVKTLRNAGYHVVNRTFPFKLSMKYDNVLLSHALYGIDNCNNIIEPAWNLVKNNGLLIVVTYRDNLDDYNILLHSIGHMRRVTNDIRFNFIINKLQSLGCTERMHFQSFITSDSIREILWAISILATNTPVGTPEKRKEIFEKLLIKKEDIKAKYRDGKRFYKFPIDHYLFVTKKS